MNDGLLDSNVFIHALTHDVHAEQCRGLLRALAEGRVQAVLEVVVVHELTYVLPRCIQGMTRADVAQYLTSVISWNGVVADKELLSETLRLWASLSVGFVDAYLAARSIREDRPVYTRNVADLQLCGASVPATFPP